MPLPKQFLAAKADVLERSNEGLADALNELMFVKKVVRNTEAIKELDLMEKYITLEMLNRLIKDNRTDGLETPKLKVVLLEQEIAKLEKTFD